MKKFLVTVVLSSLLGLSANPALTKEMENKAVDQASMQQHAMPIPMKRNHMFEERAGTWKATCDEMEDSQVYCRMFHIEQFGEWKAKNFIQLGVAWSPDAVGFVVATYLGFKEGSTVTIGIDKHKRYEITAPKGNNLMIRPEVTEKILKEMETGHKIVATFNTHSGVRHLTLANLDTFQKLQAKVKSQMAKNTKK